MEPDVGTVIRDGAGVTRFCGWRAATDGEESAIAASKLWYPINRTSSIPMEWEELDAPLVLVSVPARQLQQAPCDLDPPSNFGAGWTDGEHETFIEVRGYIAELCDFQPEQQMWRLIGWLDGRIGDNRP